MKINGTVWVASYPSPLKRQTSDPMFRYRQQLRRWATRVLLLWLFGVGAGVANACLVPSVVGLSGPAPGAWDGIQVSHHVAGAAFKVPHHEPGSARNADSPGHQEPTSKLNCQDFCDKATVSMPKQKSALDDVHGHALPPRTVSTALAVPALPRVQLRVPRRDGVWSPPIPIAFLRLAL